MQARKKTNRHFETIIKFPIPLHISGLAAEPVFPATPAIANANNQDEQPIAPQNKGFRQPQASIIHMPEAVQTKLTAPRMICAT